MLGKIIKHEFIATRRLYLPLYLMVLVLTPVFALMFRFGIESDAGSIPAILSVLGIIGFILAMIALFIASTLFIILRFYRTTATSEAFLTFTLPASPTQILTGKLIVSTIWQFLTFFMALIAIAGLLITSSIVSTHDLTQLYAGLQQLPELAGTYGIEFSQLIHSAILMGILMLIGTPSGILIYYCSIMLGQLFNDHRVIASIAMYAAITFVLQFVSMILSIPIALGMSDSVSTDTVYRLANFNLTMLLSLGLSLVFGAVCFIVTDLIMKKKLNVRA